MKKTALCLFFIATIFATFQNLESSTSLPNEIKEIVRDTCFEVVVNKPPRDTLTYEKDLPWHLVPYNVRTDKFYSIGTAFSISETDLLTAFHVIDLKNNSLVFTDFYIRDAKGNVYEVDNVRAFDSHRDFIRFTVKGRKFDKFLKLQSKYEANEPVHAVGNAYGEGIVIRQGELLGTFPETEDGKFVLLKSSSDVNFGNSGGPLINQKGEVIGLVIQRKDNIAYSLPSSEILKVGNRGHFHLRMIFGFNLLPERNIVKDFDDEVALPAHYKAVKKQYKSRFYSFYVSNMRDLMKKEGGPMFPDGEASLLPLFDFTDSYQPQVHYLNKANGKWTISGMEYQQTKIRENGVIRLAVPFDKMIFIDITRPDSIRMKDMLDSPRLSMKLLFEGMSITRDFGNMKIRILSMGDPLSVETHTDKYNRKWRISSWLMEYSDEAFITCETPTPEGMAILGFTCQSSDIELWKFDALNIIDHVHLSYYGSAKKWSEFLQGNPLLPKALENVKLRYSKNDRLEFKSGSFDLVLKNDVLPITDDLRLGINFGFTKEGNEVRWNIRRLLLSEYQKDNYFALVNWNSPDRRLPNDALAFWDGMASKAHPYTEKPFQSNNITKIATVLKTFYAPSDRNKIEKMYALFMGKEGKEDDQSIISRFQQLKNSITINR